MSSKFIFVVIGILACVLFVRFFVFYSNIFKIPPNTNIAFQTKIQTQPKLKPNGQQTSLIMPNSQRVLIRFGFDPILSYGDRVKLHGMIEYFEADNGNQVAYMQYPEFEVIERGVSSNPLLLLRERIINFFNSNMRQPYSSLILGITFGIKEEMPADFYLDLQKSGLTHVIAASGMNITMVGGFLAAALVIFIKRQYALVLAIVGICFYAILAGLEPSIVRAAIMGSLVFLAQITGRQSNGFLVLFLAAFIMLMRAPHLIFDVGFQLSFLATLGLVYLRPIFGLVPRIKKFLSATVFGEDLVTTITAQVMVLPILLVNFGSYSLVSVPVNAIVLWTVPFIMIVGGLAAILGLIVEPIGRVATYLAMPFLMFFVKVVEVFAKFPGQLNIEQIPVLFIFGYYLFVFSLILFVRNRK